MTAAVQIVERMSIEGNKRRRVLLAVARFLDEGNSSPSIAELCRRSGYGRLNVTAALDRMARDGWVVIHHGDRDRHQRSTYELPGLQPKHKEKVTMNPTTKSRAHEPVLVEVPAAFTAAWLPELQTIDWSVYREFRDEHLGAVAAFEATAGDRHAEAESLRRVADVVERVALTLPKEVDGSGMDAAMLKRAELAPPEYEADAFVNGIAVEEAKLRVEAAAARREAEGVLQGAELHEEQQRYRRDFALIGRISNHGSASYLGFGLGYCEPVRERCLAALQA